MSTLKEDALHYHSFPQPGKIGIVITKPTKTQEDLSLAYTPGVAAPVLEIAADPENVYKYTAKGNLVAVITDGTAILGLGNKGPLAAKPVMEGKAALFKLLANIDAFDLELDTKTSDEFISTVKRLAPTFGGINLEDIKGPECFEIERALIEALDIPVFHDDQHGTAIIVGAGLLNALQLQGKQLDKVKIVCIGAGAAGIASMRLLIALGAKRENMYLVDTKGVIHTKRIDLNPYKFAFARDTDKRTLEDVAFGADVIIGVSGPNILTADHLKSMAQNPVVFALSNPDPEIRPEVALAARDDLILATGRSDFPNQVNNVLCFPYLFRGALDVRAAKINQEMMIAAVHAIRKLVHEKTPEVVLAAYKGITKLEFGPEYIIPKPMDPRLIEDVPAAVARAAIDTKVARLQYPAHYKKIIEE